MRTASRFLGTKMTWGLRHEERPLIYEEHASSKAEREGNAKMSASKVREGRNERVARGLVRL